MPTSNLVFIYNAVAIDPKHLHIPSVAIKLDLPYPPHVAVRVQAGM